MSAVGFQGLTPLAIDCRPCGAPFGFATPTGSPLIARGVNPWSARRHVTPWVLAATFTIVAGCKPPTPPSQAAAANLPPAYPRSTITDPKVADAARTFTTWAQEQQANGKPVFEKVEVLPPVPTLLPYGIGTYQKVPRLPVVLTTGPGWGTLPPERREALVAAVFNDLSERLAAAKLLPTVTIQTPQGLELAWVNDVPPGRRLLHGDGE